MHTTTPRDCPWPTDVITNPFPNTKVGSVMSEMDRRTSRANLLVVPSTRV